ncbi:MAG: glycosyltransferase family 39 protein [Chloroflexota bacterium]
MLFILLLAAAWIPRTIALDAFVTVDERKWLARSANFYQALTDGDYVHTFQRAHPGVMVTWAGTLGLMQRFPSYPDETPGQLTDDAFEGWLRENSTHKPLDLLMAGRRWIVFGIALCIALLIYPLTRLFNPWIAFLAGLAIAWDPFLLALSRQLHPDGPLTALSTLALFTFLAWLYTGQHWRYLIPSAIAMGMAILAKTPASIVMFTAGILTMTEQWSQYRSAETKTLRLIRSFAIWVAFTSITFVALWPAMWVGPELIRAEISEQLGKYLLEGHNLPNYFWGEVTNDPGTFFYPVVYLFRSTPITLIGLIAALGCLLLNGWPLNQCHTRRVTLALLLFALTFMLIMTMAAKKFDRYLLPIFPALDVVAIVGWAAIINQLGQWVRRNYLYIKRSVVVVAVCSLLIISQAKSNLHHAPYYLTYYNPLVGGGRTAPDVLMIGWGEGLDQVAEWLNQQENAEHLDVVSWYGDGPLSYYLETDHKVQAYYGSVNFWFDSEYAVLYANQWQRQNPDPLIIDYFMEQPPIFTARAGKLELAHVYLIPDSPPAFTSLYTDSATAYDDKIRLAAYSLNERTVLSGERIKLTLYLKSLSEMDVDYEAHLQLMTTDDVEVWHDERWPSGRPTSQWPLQEIRQDAYTIELPPGLAPQTYQFYLSFVNPETNQSLAQYPLHDSIQNTQQSTPLPIAQIVVQQPDVVTLDAIWGTAIPN